MRTNQFAKFDDELHDSDQTISTAPRCGRPRACLSTFADATSDSRSEKTVKPSRRPRTSAFFSDTTDDDVSQEHASGSHLSMSANNPSAVRTSTELPLHLSAGPRTSRRRRSAREREMSHVPRLCMGGIEFPVTRTVLWDRRRLSDVPVSASLEQVVPQFCVTADAFKEMYRLREEKSGGRGNGPTLCYLYGDAASPTMKQVVLSGVKVHEQEAQAAGAWCIPVHPVADEKNPGLLQENYLSAIQAVQNSYRDEYTDNVASKLQPKLLVFESSCSNGNLDCQLECIASPVPFKFSLIKNLPILMTPLAASLVKRELSTQSGNFQSGYLTLDRTRKAVPLLKVDPLVLQQPLVGIWVYGIHINDAWDEQVARQQLAHPLLYFACISYLMSESIQERVGPEENTFLVALYSASDPDGSGTAVGSLPRFFECDVPDSLSLSSRLLPLDLYSNRRSCLVGVSNFSTGVVFTLSATTTNEWEAAKRHAKIPVITQSKETRKTASREVPENMSSKWLNRFMTSPKFSPCFDEGGEHEDWKSGWTITTDVVCKGTDSDSKAPSESPENIEKEACHVAATSKSEESKLGENIATTLIKLHDGNNHTPTVEATSIPNKAEDPGPQRNCIDNKSSNYRSCCKTQQLLTIQHQQILENQQRQLQGMQEQIIQLRRLLHATRHTSDKATNSFLDEEIGHDFVARASDVRTAANVSNVSSPSTRPGKGPVSFHSSLFSATSQRGSNGQFQDDSSVHSHHDEVKADDQDLSLSSLGLSSISCHSANLSSLSSSITCSAPRQKTSTNDLPPASCAHDMSQSPSTEPTAEVAEANNDVTEREKLSEDIAKTPDDVNSSSIGHELSIKELSVSLHEDEEDAALAKDKEDDERNVFVKPLLCPDAYLQKVGGFVDHHGGCFTTPPLDFHSFCVPRIKVLSDAPECDSDDEEIHLIEQKYKRLMTA
ncbi:hypothetical protein PsorP6_005297 [Peronosclerospora sorghi]|uniref:Uncharacterized protein n=1 Tax=Peronosclerospora sorghi TaxID=230839 RepID=A0ACC0W2G9_9STRA|nr:hypothetical protein PsorP6_005297 [Peronosclerospora sorghi]